MRDEKAQMRLLSALQLKHFDAKCLGWLENYKGIHKNKVSQVFEDCLLYHHNFCTNGKFSLAGRLWWTFYRVIL